MSRQYLRSVTLNVEGAGAKFDVSALRIVFDVQMGNLQTTNHANVRVYNLARETANRIAKEGQKISLIAGYEDSAALIFDGEIIQKRKGRETPVDTYLHILARTGDKAYTGAVVNRTLAAGHTFRDQVMAAYQAMQPFGVKLGSIADLGTMKMPRARTLFGMARNVMRDIGFATNTQWSIQNGTMLQVESNKSAIGGNVVVLNSQTGMVGMPVQTFSGIQVRSLLNPKIQPGRLLKIDQASIQEAAFDPSYAAEKNNLNLPALAENDGVYKAIFVRHFGDTRGSSFYSDTVCLVASGLPDSKNRPAIPPGVGTTGVQVYPETIYGPA